MRGPRLADAQSKETTHAGLPKAVRLNQNAVLQGMTLNTSVIMLFNNVCFNYGGYSFHMNGAYMDGIYIPEPGIYRLAAQVQTANSGHAPQLNIGLNGGVQQFRDSSFIALSEQTANTAYPILRCEDSVELRAGDYVQSIYTSFNVASIAQLYYSTLTVTKEGGQY